MPVRIFSKEAPDLFLERLAEHIIKHDIVVAKEVRHAIFKIRNEMGMDSKDAFDALRKTTQEEDKYYTIIPIDLEGPHKYECEIHEFDTIVSAETETKTRLNQIKTTEITMGKTHEEAETEADKWKDRTFIIKGKIIKGKFNG
jgi:hypothetical protein